MDRPVLVLTIYSGVPLEASRPFSWRNKALPA
jgi:hypothetical protein